MDDPQDSGLLRVRSVLGMRARDSEDLLRFGTEIADFSTQELIVLASSFPKSHKRVDDEAARWSECGRRWN